MGIEIIIRMQAGGNVVLDWLFILISMIIDPVVIVIFCVLLIILKKEKEKNIILLMFILLNTYLAALLKALDSDPRPFWTHA